MFKDLNSKRAVPSCYILVFPFSRFANRKPHLKLFFSCFFRAGNRLLKKLDGRQHNSIYKAGHSIM